MQYQKSLSKQLLIWSAEKGRLGEGLLGKVALFQGYGLPTPTKIAVVFPEGNLPNEIVPHR